MAKETNQKIQIKIRSKRAKIKFQKIKNTLT